MNITRTLTALAAAASLAACASQPDQISAAYVSPVPYQGMSCEALSAEGHRVNASLSQASEVQKRKASNDATAMAVGLVLFAPAVLFIGGDKAPAAELGRLKGEAQAVQAAQAGKGC